MRMISVSIWPVLLSPQTASYLLVQYCMICRLYLIVYTLQKCLHLVFNITLLRTLRFHFLSGALVLSYLEKKKKKRNRHLLINDRN